MVQGLLMNAQNITNGPAAQRGTYVGTIRTNGSAQLDHIMSGIGAGGANINLGIWNQYNRVDIVASEGDNTNSWTYNSTTWRSSNNNTLNRINWVNGGAEDTWEAEFIQPVSGIVLPCCGGNVDGAAAIGIDSTTTPATTRGQQFSTSQGGSGKPNGNFTKAWGISELGAHFVQALERCTAANSVTFFGDNNVDYIQHQLTWRGRY